jgi:hypothetical protein
MTAFQLTNEEAFLWQCARTWRHPAGLPPPDSLDWGRVQTMAQANKMQTLLHSVLETAGWPDKISPKIGRELACEARKMEQRAEGYAAALAGYLERAAAEKLPVVVLKGLSLSHNIYNHPAMRPGGDIDLLVRKEHLHASLDILDRLGNYRWHKLLDDRYYERHHLHQIRGRLDTRIWFEVHWALDHPYTLLTIDYAAMMDRARAGTLLGQPVLDLSPPDLLLGQIVHLVKHAVYLPATVTRPDTPRIILADGMLMYYLDIAETIRHYGPAFNWTKTLELAQEWGAGTMLSAVLQVCRRHLGVDIPEQVTAALPALEAGPLNGYLMHRLVDYEIANHLGQKSSRLWAFLVGYQESLVLRPIRLLDAFTYSFPPAHFLHRRYGRATLFTRVQHALTAAGQYLRNLADSLYFTWDYHRRLKQEDRQRGFIQPESG